MSADAQQHTAQRQGRFEQEDEERDRAKAQEEEETERQMKRSAARSHCSRSPGSPLACPGPPTQLERRGGPSPRGCRGDAAPAVWSLPEAAHSAPFDRAGAAKANEEDVRPAFLDAVSRETFADTNINSVSRRTNPNPNLTREPFPRP